MLGTLLWIAGFILLASGVVYALRKRRTGQSTTYVKTDDNFDDNDFSQAHIEKELETLIQEVKRKLSNELADGGHQ